MVQIYNVITDFRERYVLDEKLGMVMRREKVMRPADTVAIKHEDREYSLQADGTFHVPAHVAAFFCRMPDWNEGPNPFAEVKEAPKPRAVKMRPVEDEEPASV